MSVTAPEPVTVPVRVGATTSPAEPVGRGLLAGAASLSHAATAVRSLAAGLTAAAGQAQWQSVAARRCQERLAATAGELLAAATLLELAGDAVRAHAVTAERRAAAALELAELPVTALGSLAGSLTSAFVGAPA